MTWLDDLETPLDQAPLFFVEAQDRDPASEHERQCRVVKRLRALGLKVTASQNGQKWGLRAWNRAKAAGVEWGEADLSVTGADRFCAFIEMKDGRAKPEQHQVDWLNSRHRLGFPVAVCRTADAAVDWLRSVGAPMLEARDAA